MPGLQLSYRWRRRLVWITAFLTVAVAVTAFVLALPNGSGIPPETPLRDEPADVVRDQREVPVTRSLRREVNPVLVEFVRAAVARRDPDAAWRLATPALRAGSTRNQWRRGELPVFPYPANPRQASSWVPIGSYENDLIVEFVLTPPKGSTRGPVEFNAELKAVGKGKSRHWLVDSFIPVRSYPAATAKSRPAATEPLPPDFKPRYPKGRLSPLWFVVPGGILALILLVPLGIFVVGWGRGVRAERVYRSRLD